MARISSTNSESTYPDATITDVKMLYLVLWQTRDSRAKPG